MTTYEIWDDSDEKCRSVTMFPAGSGSDPHYLLLGPHAKLLRTIEANSWNEAMTKHHELMGWEPYVPIPEEP